MRRDREENRRIQEQAGENMVVFLQNWRAKVKRMKIYRACLMLVLIISCTVLTGMIYYDIDSSVPSVINVRAGE